MYIVEGTWQPRRDWMVESERGAPAEREPQEGPGYIKDVAAGSKLRIKLETPWTARQSAAPGPLSIHPPTVCFFDTSG